MKGILQEVRLTTLELLARLRQDDDDSSSDPKVKPSFEIIHVESCTSETEIEKLLNDILNPLITVLRERNGLSKCRGVPSIYFKHNRSIRR